MLRIFLHGTHFLYSVQCLCSVSECYTLSALTKRKKMATEKFPHFKVSNNSASVSNYFQSKLDPSGQR